MSEDPAAPLTAQDIERRVKETMIAQQQEIIEIAGRQALQAIREEQKRTAPALLNAIDGQGDDRRAHDNHEWRTQVNKDNFNTLFEIERMWQRSERFVGALEVPRDQSEIKTSALEFIKKGKDLTHDRMKVIKFADRDGWQAALNFVGDNIAETPEEAKRMKKGVKEAEKDRESKAARGRRDRDRRRNSYGRDGQGSSRDREYSDYSTSSYSNSGQSGSGYSSRRFTDNRYCYNCGLRGHITRLCPRK